MKTKQGEEYLSPKDAAALSSFTEKQLRALCLEGKVKSRWIGGGFFVEKESLLSIVRKGSVSPYENIDVQKSFDVWHGRVFRKFGVLTAVVAVFLVIFIIPVFFLSENTFSGFDVTQAPASFNSVGYVANADKGTLAAVGGMNEILAKGIEKVFMALYNLVSSWF